MEVPNEQNQLEKALEHLNQALSNLQTALQEIEAEGNLNHLTYVALQGDFNILSSINWQSIRHTYIPEMVTVDDKTFMYRILWVLWILYYLVNFLRGKGVQGLIDHLAHQEDNFHYDYLNYNVNQLIPLIRDFQNIQTSESNRTEHMNNIMAIGNTIAVIISILAKYKTKDDKDENFDSNAPGNVIIEEQ